MRTIACYFIILFLISSCSDDTPEPATENTTTQSAVPIPGDIEKKFDKILGANLKQAGTNCYTRKPNIPKQTIELCKNSQPF